jgi:hypothetical protein
MQIGKDFVIFGVHQNTVLMRTKRLKLGRTRKSKDVILAAKEIPVQSSPVKFNLSEISSRILTVRNGIVFVGGSSKMVEVENRKVTIRAVANEFAETQPILYHGQLLYFKPSAYLPEPEQLWQLGAVVSSKELMEALTVTKLIDGSFIEALLLKLPYSLYMSSDGLYLVASDDELSQLDFGPLTPIPVEEAARRFGVSAVERATEKTFVPI